MTAAILVILGVAYLAWKWGPRRAREPGFRFVYVNQDGSARELSPEEQRYLSEKFEGGDSGRPYIKWSYESRDGWGSLSGYLERRRVPRRIMILPVSPKYDAAVKALNEGRLDYRDEGDLVVKNPDGSITYFTNPEIPHKKRFERACNWHLEQQRRLEELAKFIA
jgi:hypothetical protein